MVPGDERPVQLSWLLLFTVQDSTFSEVHEMEEVWPVCTSDGTAEMEAFGAGTPWHLPEKQLHSQDWRTSSVQPSRMSLPWQ